MGYALRKHGVPQADQVWALPGQSIDDGAVWLYIGHPHAQTARELEILVNVYPDGRESVVYHAMELGSKFRRYREENPNE
ncbi:MAG: hypothetical protein ABI130_16305 [Leifsonia sp.]